MIADFLLLAPSEQISLQSVCCIIQSC